MNISGKLTTIGETLSITTADGSIIDIDGLPISSIRQIVSSFMDTVTLSLTPVTGTPATIPTTGTRYTASADGLTVLDSLTGLTWQQEGSLKSMDADAADAYVASLNESSFGGHADWRMPNDHELLSIVDRARRSPAIDPVFSAKSEWYWTSSPLVSSDGASSSGRVWVVDFNDGGVSLSHRDSLAFVRAVRGPSPAGQ